MNKHQSSDMQLARWFHFHREVRDICVREYDNDRYYDNSYECQCDRGSLQWIIWYQVQNF